MLQPLYRQVEVGIVYLRCSKVVVPVLCICMVIDMLQISRSFRNVKKSFSIQFGVFLLRVGRRPYQTQIESIKPAQKWKHQKVYNVTITVPKHSYIYTYCCTHILRKFSQSNRKRHFIYVYLYTGFATMPLCFIWYK